MSVKPESFMEVGARFCPEAFVRASVKFICKQIAHTNARSLVLGVSGGIDSAVVARLCQLATQRYERKFHTHIELVCVFLPSLATSAHSSKDTKALAHVFSLPIKQHTIAGYHEQFIADFPRATPLEVGNFCARVRMALLYHYSSMYQGIVVGTSNKSELLLGYGTIFGDLACAINPIASLLKSQIFTLAHFLHIPESIIAKPPSADLYPDQSDEGDLGFAYEQIDILLAQICANATKARQKHAKVKSKHAKSTTSESTSTLFATSPLLLPKNILRKKLYREFDPALVDMVLGRITRNAFKLMPPTMHFPAYLELAKQAKVKTNRAKKAQRRRS